MSVTTSEERRALNLQIHALLGYQVYTDDEMRAAWERRRGWLDYEGDAASGFTRTWRVIPHRTGVWEPTFEQIVPDYAGDIREAFKVVEKMQAYSCDFSLEKAGLAWYADFRLDGTVLPGSPTPAEAICRAALACSRTTDGGER